MNRPIFIVVIGYIIGIIWGIYLKISIFPFFIGLILLYIIINLQYSKRKFKILSIKRYFRYVKLFFKLKIILIIIISSFISNTIIKYKEKEYNYLFKDKQQLELVALVVSNKTQKDYYNRYEIKTNTNKKLYINTDKELEYGDKIKVKGEFQEAETERNYKGFNYKQYLKTINIYGIIKTSKIEVLEKKSINKIMLISNKIFLQIKSNIERTYNKNISGIILGIILGYTEQIDENIKEDFSTSNLSHVLAVSGMHISYIIFLSSCSTQKIVGKRKSKIITSLILLVYMFITGFSVSVVRACIMGILFCISFVVYRKSDTLNNISISALIILIYNPYSVIGLSFLLTYGGTLGIIYYKPIIEKILKNIKIKNRRWKYIFLRIQKRCEKIIEVVSVSGSAQIIIAPIMVIKFNVIGIGFLITNLLLSFIISPIVIGGFIQIFLSFISIDISIILAKFIESLIYLLLLISKIDIGNFKIVTPNLFQIIFYYISICILRYIYNVFHSKNYTQTEKRIKNTIILIRYKIRPYLKRIICIFMICFMITYLVVNISNNLKIYFIDVGQGDSTLLVTPRNKTILIDGGGSATYDVGKNVLIPYLLDRKIKKIDYLIISHFDEDHVRRYFYSFRRTGC